jgi:EAL domain-containing protein (putative c-di-GMP-specific phosphodiesterase class I)
MAVIAEGVETPAQLALLATGGCELYQGFLLSEPVDEDALVELMER